MDHNDENYYSSALSMAVALLLFMKPKHSIFSAVFWFNFFMILLAFTGMFVLICGTGGCAPTTLGGGSASNSSQKSGLNSATKEVHADRSIASTQSFASSKSLQSNLAPIDGGYISLSIALPGGGYISLSNRPSSTTQPTSVEFHQSSTSDISSRNALATTNDFLASSSNSFSQIAATTQPSVQTTDPDSQSLSFGSVDAGSIGSLSWHKVESNAKSRWWLAGVFLLAATILWFFPDATFKHKAMAIAAGGIAILTILMPTIVIVIAILLFLIGALFLWRNSRAKLTQVVGSVNNVFDYFSQKYGPAAVDQAKKELAVGQDQSTQDEVLLMAKRDRKKKLAKRLSSSLPVQTQATVTTRVEPTVRTTTVPAEVIPGGEGGH